MSKLREIRERRQQVADSISQMADRVGKENRDFTAEERASWDKANADFDRLGREQRAEEVRLEQDRRAGDDRTGRDDYAGRRGRTRDNVQHTDEQRTLAVRAWFKKQVGIDLSRRERSACQALRFNPRKRELALDTWDDRRRQEVRRELASVSEARKGEVVSRVSRESRANMSTQLPTSGGYLVAPGTLANTLEVNLLAFGGALQVADVMTTQHGEPFLWPTADDTSNSGALLGENISYGAGVNPSLAQKRMDAYKFSSTPVLIPTEVLEDTQFDLPGLIGEMLGVRLGRGQAPYLATGTGASQPEGIVTGAAAGITAASATAFTLDELIRVQHTVDPAYRSMPGCGWMMHDLILSYVRRLKDGQGRFLWVAGEQYQSGVKEGVPDKLLGWPIQVCQEMASTVATGNITVIGGLLSKFKVRKVRGVRIYRLQERYRDLDQDGFVAFERVDSKVVHGGNNPIRKLTQA